MTTRNLGVLIGVHVSVGNAKPKRTQTYQVDTDLWQTSKKTKNVTTKESWNAILYE
jgi:hypothetical protein